MRDWVQWLHNHCVRNKPEDEDVIFMTGGTSSYRDMVFTNKAVYFRRTMVPRFWFMNLAAAERRPWDEIEAIEIKTPVWLLIYAIAVGFRIKFKNGGSVFFLGWDILSWLKAKDEHAWPVVHAGRIWDKPGVFRLRQFLFFLAFMAAMWWFLLEW